jgi:hypothetical protein
MKIEAACLSETSVYFYQTIRNHIPEDTTHHNHFHWNLKSNIYDEYYGPLGCNAVKFWRIYHPEDGGDMFLRKPSTPS